jgi:integrase/recombinase XerD
LLYNNIKTSSKKNKIQGIVRFAKFLKIKYGHDKSFKECTREDFIDFQTSLRRSEEKDLLHRWVGTYNQFLRVLKPFFKWLYAPDQELKIRKLPPILEGINQLHRKEVTIYTAKDMWTDEDDQLFLKYCEDPLIRLYHTMSRDISNRPHELLRVRIGDIIEYTSPDGKKYAKFTIGAGGKTKQREVMLYHSYPSYIEYLQKHHPTKSTPNSFLFKRRDPRSLYTNTPMKSSTLTINYWLLKKKFFPKLLKDVKLSLEDKEKIKPSKIIVRLYLNILLPPPR